MTLALLVIASLTAVAQEDAYKAEMDMLDAQGEAIVKQYKELMAKDPKRELPATRAQITAFSNMLDSISEQQLHGHAAICSRHAAELYGMKVLEEGIETNKHNFTRFLVVSDPLNAPYLCTPDTSNKASLVFSLPHNEGSLSQVLSILSFYRINLTKIQSLPIIGREWEYLFYVDLTYDSYIRYRQSLDAIRPLTRQLNVLGEYKEAAPL